MSFAQKRVMRMVELLISHGIKRCVAKGAGRQWNFLNHVNARTITASRNKKQTVKPVIASRRFAWIRVSIAFP
jgi:hypothetical protein